MAEIVDQLRIDFSQNKLIFHPLASDNKQSAAQTNLQPFLTVEHT